MRQVEIPSIGADTAWREAARAALGAGIPPEAIIWGGARLQNDLFAGEAVRPSRGVVTVPASFVALANKVVWHSDPERFARLYTFLWRLKDAPQLMSDRGDADLARLRQMEKNVRRCQHKMKAFLRFREIGEPEANRRSFAAWFEPTHHTVEPTAEFFASRFGDMDWRIFTPDICATFEGGKLSFSEGQAKPELPEDASEELWITYFRNIFNPARLKVRAMQSEMPKKYWKNMPEAASIPQMIAQAPAQARAMAEAAPTLPPQRMAQVQAQLAKVEPHWAGPAGALPAAIAACTRCPLHCNATQAVPGEGPGDARLMIVGEQPGDQEDLTGKPFVGPAGQLFDQLAGRAGMDRAQAYVTNAVKHFKFRASGRRRIHQRPSASEIDHCRWWLEAELAQVRPKLVIAMGATAARALTGDGDRISLRRGSVETAISGQPVLITYHPSFLLRQPDPVAEAQFVGDLKTAAGWI